MNVRYDLAEGGYRQPANYRGSDLVRWPISAEPFLSSDRQVVTRMRHRLPLQANGSLGGRCEQGNHFCPRHHFGFVGKVIKVRLGICENLQ